MKIKAKLRAFFEIENLVTANIVAWSLWYLLKVCNVSLYRLGNSFRDLGISLYFWFLDTMSKLSGSDAPSVNITVNDIPPIDIQDYIPIDLEEFIFRCQNLPDLFFNEVNFRHFNIELFFLTYKIVLYGTFFVLLFTLIAFICHDLLTSENERENGYVTESYMKLVSFVYGKIKPVVIAVRDYFVRLLKLSGIVFLLVIIWLTAFNVLTFVVEFFAYYTYFICRFDLQSILIQLYKLILDFAIMLSTAPLIVWVALVATIYAICAVNIGLDRLRHGEAKNCGVVKALSIMILIVGPMGFGKTELATDIGLTAANVQKTDSQKKLFKFDMLFPLFSWEIFEKDLAEAFSTNVIKDFTTAKIFVDKIELEYQSFPENFCLKYRYDISLFPMEKDVGNSTVRLFDVMRDYAKGFYVYMTKNPHLSNYSIRTDGHHDDSEFFKLWKGDFFKPDRSYSEYSHILDQDIMRHKKLKMPGNPLAGSFGHGIINITEYGKSHPNRIESEGIDKSSDEANPKNDGHNIGVKYIRHQNNMVDHQEFVLLITDEQRPEDVPATLRDVLQVVNIVDKGEVKNALPGFWIADMVYDYIYEPMKNTYYEYRNKRGDRSVFTLLFKSIVSAFSNFYLIAYNLFGYQIKKLQVASGRAYGNNSDSSVTVKEYEWQYAYAKGRADRYASDCHSQFFEKKQLGTMYGINNTPRYQDLYSSAEELLQQHDYSVDELFAIVNIVQKKIADGNFTVEKEQETKKQSSHKNVVDDDDCDNFF